MCSVLFRRNITEISPANIEIPIKGKMKEKKPVDGIIDQFSTFAAIMGRRAAAMGLACYRGAMWEKEREEDGGGCAG